MRGRSVAASVAVAVGIAVGGPVAAASADPVGLMSRDVLSLASTGQWTRSAPAEGIVGASVASGRVVLTSDRVGSSGLQIALADASLPQPGTTYVLGSSTTANRVLGACASPGPGSMRVDDVAYDGATVSHLVASYGMRCGSGVWVSGTVRVGSDAPTSVVQPAPVRTPLVGRNQPTPVTVTFANSGAAPTGALGPAAMDGTAAGSADFVIAQDDCLGVVLAPGDSCTVDVRFSRATAGTSGGLVTVPDQSAGGGRLLAGVSGTAVAAPNPPTRVVPFAARGAAGIAWWASEGQWRPTAYRVERLDQDVWTDASGALPTTQSTWADTTLAAGSSAQYRVVAENQDGPGAPSQVVTASRQATGPQVGGIDAITVDADPGGQTLPSGFDDKVVTDGITWQGPPANTSWTSSWFTMASGGSVTLPDVVPGPGTYAVDDAVVPVSPTSVHLSLSDTCDNATGTFTVDEVAYTSTAQLETLSGHYRLVCPDGVVSYGDLRWHSTQPFGFVDIDPPASDLGRTPVGTASADATVTVRNTGSQAQSLGARILKGDAAADWRITDDTCPATLASGATCAVTLQATPSRSGPRPATLVVEDSTHRGQHSAALSVTGTSLPSAPTAVSALRVPGSGVDLSWSPPTDDGGTRISGYVVRRTTAQGTTVTNVPEETTFADPGAPTDATYTVAAVSEIGTGAATASVNPKTATEPLFATTVGTVATGTSYAMGVVGLPGGTRVLPWTSRSSQTGTAWGLSLSPDGRTLASVQSDAGGWVVWREPVDRSAAPTKLYTSTARLGQVRWSPDGTRLAVAQADVHTVHVLNAGTGAVLGSFARLDDPDWLPDSRTLVASDRSVQDEPLVRVDATTGRRLSQLANTSGAQHTAVSPDGRWIAYRSYFAGLPGLYIVPTAGGTPRKVSPLWAGDVTWRPDSRSLAFSSGTNVQGWWTATVGVDGTVGTPRQNLLGRYAAFDLMAWGGARVSIAPSGATTGPRAAFTITAGALPTGTTFRCAVDALAPVDCGTAYTTPALATGAHTLRVSSSSPDGRVTVATRTFTVDATAPATKLTAPTVTVTTGTSVGVTYSATDGSGIKSYDVRYRRAGTSGVFGSYVSWLNGTTSTSVKLPVSAGYRYCVSVRARDRWGNTSGWTAERCTARVLDDRSLTAATSGWSRVTGSALYMGTGTSTTRKGAALTRTSVASKQVHLVATKCSGCGSVAVYVGATKVGSASLYAATTANRVLIALPATALHKGTLKIVVTSATGKLVRIDGIAVRST